jgi:hypothetical protein
MRLSTMPMVVSWGSEGRLGAALGVVPADDVRDRVEADLEAAVVLADRLERFNLRGRPGVESGSSRLITERNQSTQGIPW